MRPLTTLRLHSCQSIRATAFLQSLSQSAAVGRLTELHVEGLGATAVITPTLEASLRLMLGSLQQCRMLTLHDCVPVCSLLAQAPALLRQLRTLSVRGTPVSTLEVQELLWHAPQLTCVELSVERCSDSLMQAFAAAPQLESITIEDTAEADGDTPKLTDIGMHMISRNPRLRELSMSRNSSAPFLLTSVCLMWFSLSASLESLMLRCSHHGLRLTDDAVQTLLRGCSRLHTLQLQGCSRLQTPFRDLGAGTMPPLVSVHIGGSPCLEDSTVQELCEACAATLEKLLLPGCRSIGDGCCEAIALLPRLRQLVLNATMVSDAGAAVLSTAVAGFEMLCLRRCDTLTAAGNIRHFF